jgi:hypothetical protein
MTSAQLVETKGTKEKPTLVAFGVGTAAAFVHDWLLMLM